MKKTFLFILAALLFAIPVFASEQPTCSEGSHYEGEYVETETCNRVCTFSFFGRCLRYENQCTTSGSWVGSCVANEVIEEEPVEEEPVIDIPATSTPKIIYTDSLMAVLANECKEEFIEYSEWSPCINGFNMQIRTAKPLNGCHLTGLQQARLVKRCNSIGLGID